MADLLYLIGFQNPPQLGSFFTGDLQENLHLTILNNFNVPTGKFDEVRVKFDRALSFFDKFKLNVTGRDTFTSISKDTNEIKYIPVLKVSGVDSMGNTVNELHSTLADIVVHSGGNFNNGEYIFDNYSPHISYGDNLSDFNEMSTLSLVHHRGGFGVDVVNYYNYSLK